MSIMTASRRFAAANDKADIHSLVEMVPVLASALLMLLAMNTLI